MRQGTSQRKILGLIRVDFVAIYSIVEQILGSLFN